MKTVKAKNGAYGLSQAGQGLFSVVTTNEEKDGAWTRVGAGMTRSFALRRHDPDFFDMRDWEELL